MRIKIAMYRRVKVGGTACGGSGGAGSIIGGDLESPGRMISSPAAKSSGGQPVDHLIVQMGSDPADQFPAGVAPIVLAGSEGDVPAMTIGDVGADFNQPADAVHRDRDAQIAHSPAESDRSFEPTH
jgi:hypothetical protein